MDLFGVTDLLTRSPTFERAREQISAPGTRPIIGVPDSAKAAAIAALIAGADAPVLVLTARPHRAEALAEEIAVWLGGGLPMLPFPEREALPYERLSPGSDAIRRRLEVLSQLSRGTPAVIVASALAIAQRTLSPAEVRETVRRLNVGERFEIEQFLRAATAIGYSVEPVVEEAGQIARRGRIIDVFPPASELPVRIELMGAEIESLRLFDQATQRSVRTIDDVLITPARELVLHNASLKPLEELDLSGLSGETRERFEEELALLRGGEMPAALDFYVPLLASGTLPEHLPEAALVILDEADDVEQALAEVQQDAEAAREELEARGEIPRGLPPPLAGWPELGSALAATSRQARLSRWASEESPDVIRLPFAPAAAYAGRLRKLVVDYSENKGAGRTVIVSQQSQRLAEMFLDEGTPIAVSERTGEGPPRRSLVHGSLPEGWRFDGDGADLRVITDTEIFGFVKQRRAPPRKTINREAFLAELTPGSFVVHIDHGIARFAGVIHKSTDGHVREYLELHYAEGDKLYVPTDNLDRVSRYIGPSDRTPQPTRLASGDWQRAKQRVRRAVRALARDLLALYAAREVMPGYAFPPDSPWQLELEASFPYIETPDQVTAISAVKADMEMPRPMDRLVCGDVGYGKTEVAIRAAFKAVMDGRQVAVLVPTTVLAQQHYETFRERLGAFPVRVEVLSRLRSDQEQKRVVEELGAGSVDIAIGTHRLIQKDVRFKELGMIVIDEEQRFGVAHKEYLKKMRREVDVLTLSATPIPRTLYMAMGGVRDMSTMETPPEERLPIKTYVSESDDRLIREAIIRELERGGQVYFVHNRVRNIEMVAEKVQEIVPQARVNIGHGQMDEKLLAQVMEGFTHGRTDMLVCTTIIESGLDIPNVNTIIINQADKLGLAQLYQLRGRVGRGAHRAYAYLLYDRKARLTDAARRRLQTIFEATELGAGFQIALRDLEIRGAGNLLGAEQSGYMAAIGFDLYVRLLSGAVERMRAVLRGEPAPPERETPAITIDLPLSAHLPQSYVGDLNQRLALYQRLSAAAGPEDVSRIGQEMVDRFGEPPPLARNLLYVAAVRAFAQQAAVQSITIEDGAIVLRLQDGETLAPDTLADTAPRGVQVGRSMVRVESGDGWRQRLLAALEQLAAAWAKEQPVPA